MTCRCSLLKSWCYLFKDLSDKSLDFMLKAWSTIVMKKSSYCVSTPWWGQGSCLEKGKNLGIWCSKTFLHWCCFNRVSVRKTVKKNWQAPYRNSGNVWGSMPTPQCMVERREWLRFWQLFRCLQLCVDCLANCGCNQSRDKQSCRHADKDYQQDLQQWSTCKESVLKHR